jgi:hypothetical protein
MMQVTDPYNQLCANQLINEVERRIKQPYNKWKIGIADSANLDTEHHINVTVFNPQNSEAILATYDYFREHGMVAKPFSGNDAKYLYLYKIGSKKMPYSFL